MLSTVAVYLFSWALPLYVLVRAAYRGARDGLVTRLPAKLWLTAWAAALGVITVTLTFENAADNFCARYDYFVAVWLASFSVMHGAGMFVFRKFDVTTRIRDELERRPWYPTVRWADRSFGAVLEAISMLGLLHYAVRMSTGESGGPVLSAAGRIVDGTGETLGELAGLAGRAVHPTVATRPTASGSSCSPRVENAHYLPIAADIRRDGPYPRDPGRESPIC